MELSPACRQGSCRTFSPHVHPVDTPSPPSRKLCCSAKGWFSLHVVHAACPCPELPLSGIPVTEWNSGSADSDVPLVYFAAPMLCFCKSVFVSYDARACLGTRWQKVDQNMWCSVLCKMCINIEQEIPGSNPRSATPLDRWWRSVTRIPPGALLVCVGAPQVYTEPSLTRWVSI